MPISDMPTAQNMSGGAPQGNVPGMNLPALSMPGVQAPAINPGSIQTNPNQVFSLLAQQPTSLTGTIAPLLQQIFGMQGNMMQPMFANQGAQGASQAQSDSMRRGITGSNIEMAGMQQAYGQANQGYNQYIAQMLQSLVPFYSGAAQFDIGQNRSYQTDMAQAVGQQMSSETQQRQFSQQLQGMMDQARMNANAQMVSGIAQGVGAIGGGLASHSDIRLKENIVPLGPKDGLNWYRFTYKQDCGIDLPRGPQVGVMAHEVAREHPDCIGIDRGYLTVNYNSLLGL